MRVLLVNPAFPITCWGFQFGLPLANRRVSLPPLGLLTVAAFLPSEWEVRLVDLNARPLRNRDLRWADVVFVGGMRIQSDSMHEVLAQARRLGRPTIVGGAAPTASPQEFSDADVVFVGEVEGRVPSLLRAVDDITQARDRTHAVLRPTAQRPDMAITRVPRFELLRLNDYASMSVQYSRGCPYQCEFCDVIEIFGRVPGVKSKSQVLAELTALYDIGYRGTLFFVDDNFIGNRRAARELLPVLQRWQQERGHPLEFYTEASVNLASDPQLVTDMVNAGFSAIFLGLETPSTESLEAAGKKQNLKIDLREAVQHLTSSGLEVMGGFIVGFDQDAGNVFDLQHRFISSSPIPIAMVGLLTALPGTALWRRLHQEGRLRTVSTGDQFDRPNFEPAMDEEVLLQGYADLVSALYSPEAYYERCGAYVDQTIATPGRRPLDANDIATVARSLVGIGIRSPRRWHFWRLLWRSLRRAPHTIPWVIAHAIMGEHLIRYTDERVIPRIHLALDEVRQERNQLRRPLGPLPQGAALAGSLGKARQTDLRPR